MKTDYQDYKSLAVDYWHDELNELDRAEVDAALDASPELAEHFARVGDLLDAAIAEEDDWTEEREAANLDAVFDALGEDAFASARPGTAAHAVMVVQDDEPANTNRPVWTSLALVAIALIATLAVLRPWAPEPSGPASDVEMEPESPLAESTPADGADTSAEESPEAIPAVEAASPLPTRTAALLTEESELEAFEGRLFTETNTALVSERNENGDALLRVDAGTVLVEFLPSNGAGLRVETPHGNVVVTGTVFSVRVGDRSTAVAVYEGSVEFDSPATGVTPVGSGEALDSTGTTQPVSEAVRELVDVRINLAEHASRLDSRTPPQPIINAPSQPSQAEAGPRGEVTAPEGPGNLPPQRADEPTTEPSEAPVATLPTTADYRGSVQAFMSSRDYASAASELERALPSLRGDEQIEARLDLARIYTRMLNRPQDAAPHIRALLHANISDSTRARLVDELCEHGNPGDAQWCQ